MKYLFTSLIVICAVFNSLQAQQVITPEEKRFGLGIFAGLTYSFPLVSTQFPVHFDPQANVLAGVDLHYRLSDRASLRLQPSWTQVNDVKPKNSWAIPIFSLTVVA